MASAKQRQSNVCQKPGIQKWVRKDVLHAQRTTKTKGDLEQQTATTHNPKVKHQAQNDVKPRSPPKASHSLYKRVPKASLYPNG